MTRIRVLVGDGSAVNFEKLEKIEEVIRVIRGDVLQIVVGPGRSKRIKHEMEEILGENSNLECWKKNKVSIGSLQRSSKLKKALEGVANIFIPLIPAIIAAGLLNGIAGYFVNVYSISGRVLPLWLTFMQTMGEAFFAYFSVYIGINAAREFGATPGLGGMVGAITISGNINIFSKALGLYNEAVPLNSILTTGKGGIIGVIAGVYILSIVERRFRDILPDMIETILAPFISIVVVGAITVFGIMPLAGFISDGIIMVLQTLIMTQGPLAVIGGFILSSLFLPMVVVGLHHGLIPFYMIQLQEFGNISLYPILAMAGAGQVGAAIAVYVKIRNNEKLKTIIKGALPVGVLGIGEPLIYGVTLPLGRPFITAALGGGIGGAFCALSGVASTAFGPSGITAIPLIVPGKIIYYILGLTTAYIGGFLITYFFGIPREAKYL